MNEKDGLERPNIQRTSIEREVGEDERKREGEREMGGDEDEK